MRKYDGIDISILAALLAGLFAIVNLTNGDWLMGIFFAAFAVIFVVDNSDKRKLYNEIEHLREELKKTKK